MPKRRDMAPAEIVPLTTPEKNAENTIALARMIEGSVQKVPSSEGAELQPFFGTNEVAVEIKRRQTVNEQRKFLFYFDEWGCMVCGTRTEAHKSCGMCTTCHSRITARLAKVLRDREPPENSARPEFRDPVALAREALAHLPEATAQPGFRDNVALAREALAPSLKIPQTAAQLESKRVETRTKQRAAQETLWADQKHRARMRDARNRKRPARAKAAAVRRWSDSEYSVRLIMAWRRWKSRTRRVDQAPAPEV